jgi:hypothetical protein
MKIKTIVEYVPDTFDNYINQALADGYLLEHRGLLPPDRYGNSAHYAQLVLPDPLPRPEPVSPVDLLRQIKEFCKNVPVHTCKENCPMFDWCGQYTGGYDPCDWGLPEVGA